MTNDSTKFLDNIGLSTALIDKLNIKIDSINTRANTPLFKPGDSCNAFLLLLKGAIKVEITTRSGRDITLYKMQAGDNCILTTSAIFDDKPYYAYGTAETDISALAISNADFFSAIEHSATFARYVLNAYAIRMASIIELVDRMGSKNIILEVCNYLLKHADQHGKISKTQLDIAQQIGSAREVISRKLAQLERMNLIQRGRGEINIKNKQALEDYRLSVT